MSFVILFSKQDRLLTNWYKSSKSTLISIAPMRRELIKNGNISLKSAWKFGFQFAKREQHVDVCLCMISEVQIRQGFSLIYRSQIYSKPKDLYTIEILEFLKGRARFSQRFMSLFSRRNSLNPTDKNTAEIDNYNITT